MEPKTALYQATRQLLTKTCLFEVSIDSVRHSYRDSRYNKCSTATGVRTIKHIRLTNKLKKVSQTPSPVLENMSIVDTPGILAGDKQRIERGYDFTAVIEWFAQRADLILLFFDSHKLDISNEFKNAIHCLRGQEEKVRVVLNKSDMVSEQQLMRVYGALMWSLGKVVQTPEVVRVYLSSFWTEKPLNCFEDCRELIEAESKDLLRDLKELRRNSAIRKINEIVKRARLARVSQKFGLNTKINSLRVYLL